MNEEQLQNKITKPDDIITKHIKASYEKMEELTLEFYYELINEAIEQTISAQNSEHYITIRAKHKSLSKICCIKEFPQGKIWKGLCHLIDIELLEELLKEHEYSVIFQDYGMTDHNVHRYPYDKEYHITLITTLESVKNLKSFLQTRNNPVYTK